VDGFQLVPDGHGFILSGELDVSSAAAFEKALGDVLHVGGPVGVDMRRLRFMDSSGIKTIVAAAKAAPGPASSFTASTTRYRGSSRSRGSSA
jgi:anti-anti-sigma factor